MPAAGFRIGRELSAEQSEDVAYGFHIAKEISRLEIGQIAVVKNGTVLAVEGFEGTDACLTRGGQLHTAGDNRARAIVDEPHSLMDLFPLSATRVTPPASFEASWLTK